jgi:hypothetical protein
MAGALTSDAEERVLRWLFVDAETTPAPEMPIIVHLIGTNGDATDGGVEIIGDSYVPTDASFSFTADTPGIWMANTFDIEFNSLSSTSAVTVNGIELWDSSETAPLRIAYATFDSPYVVAVNDPFLISTGQIKVKLL